VRALDLLHAAARGAYPAENGLTEVVGPLEGAPAAVLSFTAHHVVATDVPAREVHERIDPADLKGPLAPGVLAWLARRTGLTAGSLDVVLAWLPERSPAAAIAVREVEPGEHPRVARAQRWRQDVRVFDGADGMVVLGRGLAGRLELSVEVDPRERGRGLARHLVTAALAAAGPDEPVFAQVAAANAASLRALQPAGFVAIGAEVLYGAPADFLRRG
jgi:GNAT superfamily N-acetyltransferase